ncbi:ankyrin repeat domain-containing protein [Thalassobellus suaedae]|uniref:Ankyrin repeat domain-containing protein n=1 Tax=Thalassobellus suaedae TaxID=3074124 RepID=A0ABY9Y538_9FLAO|nr:ankyrin repeat domain-containing protein [Flavobacteriaceae bacterium HL-DH10]
MKKNYFLILFIFCSSLYAQKDIYDVCRNGTVEEILKLYNESPDIINTTNNSGYSPLILACYHGNDNIVSFLVHKVKDINGSSDYGTPLMAAVVKGNLKITKILLDKKADPNIADPNGTTALHYAVLFKLTDIAKLLVKAGAKHSLKDNNGKSAYDYALINKNQELLTLLKK